MDHFELVEKLRERTGVSYEDAKAALEAADWDLLDAIVILETEGKIAQGAKDYSTRREESREEHARRHGEFKSAMSRIGSQIANFIEWGNRNFVDVARKGDAMFSLPLTVVVILIIICFPWIIPVLIVSLFFGFQYNIRATEKGTAAVNAVNQVMEKASEMANSIKQEAQNHKKEDK